MCVQVVWSAAALGFYKRDLFDLAKEEVVKKASTLSLEEMSQV